MKKLVILVLITIPLSILIMGSNRVFGLNNQTNQIEVNLCTISSSIILANESINQVLNLNEIEVYRIHDENEQTIVYHLKDQKAYLIFRELTWENEFYVEVIIWNSPILTFEATVEIDHFNHFFRRRAEDILNTSERGIELLSNQIVFETNHFTTQERSRSFNTIVDPHTITEMTQSNRFLAAYQPRRHQPGNFRFSDEITNIVPESWFFQAGNHVYVGRTYGVVMTTTFHANHSWWMGGSVHSSTVLVFETRVGLPFMERAKNSDGSVNFNFYSTETFSLTIEPVIELNFWAIRRSDVPAAAWSMNQYDPHAVRMIWARTDTSNRNFVAPIHNVIAVDHDILGNLPRTNYFGIESYSFHPILNVSQGSINHINIANQRIAFVNNIATAASLLNLPGGPLLSAGITFINIAHGHARLFQINLEQQLHINLEKAQANGRLNISFKGRPTNPNGTRPDPYPGLLTFHMNSFQSAFTNRALGSYRFEFRTAVSTRIGDWWNESFGINNFVSYNFFNHLGQPLLDNMGRIIRIDSFNRFEHFNHDIGHSTLTRNLVNNSNHQVTINTPHAISSLTFRNGNANQLLRVNMTSNQGHSTFVDVYNQRGQHIHTLNLRNGMNEDSKLLMFNRNEMYHFVFRFTNGRTGGIGLSFESISPNINEARLNTQLRISNHDVNRNTFIHHLRLVNPGQFGIFTSTNHDTTLWLYDLEGRLLHASYNPFANWNDDIVDLNASLDFRSDLVSQRYILVVRINQRNVRFDTIIQRWR